MQLLLMQGVPVSHHTSAGRLLGLSAPMLSQNIHLRRAQFRAADDPARCLEAARALVVAKVRNQRTVLRPGRRADLVRRARRPARLGRYGLRRGAPGPRHR
jgi:CRISPR/Cas system-associated endonuclease Cas1